MRVAVVQFTATRDKAANRERLAASVTRALEEDADLIVAPEAAMHPFGRVDEPLAPVAESLDGPFVDALQTVMKGSDATLLAGMFTTAGDDNDADGWVDNTVVAIDGHGLRGSYRKVHLFDSLGWQESDRLRAGNPGELLVLPVADLVVGVLTCYDLRFPELTRRLVDHGATLLAVPSAWVAGPLKEDHWLTLARARAIENTCYLAGAGQGPPDFAGRSLVVDPMGVVVAQCGEVDGIAVTGASTARVAEVRAKLPSLEHRRFTVTPR